MLLLTLAASLCALLGTWMQMVAALGHFSESDPAGHEAFKTVESWKDEQKRLLSPVRRLNHRKLVASLLKDSPSEAADYARARRAVWSWVLLVLASAAATAASVLTLLGIK